MLYSSGGVVLVALDHSTHSTSDRDAPSPLWLFTPELLGWGTLRRWVGVTQQVGRHVRMPSSPEATRRRVYPSPNGHLITDTSRI